MILTYAANFKSLIEVTTTEAFFNGDSNYSTIFIEDVLKLICEKVTLCKYNIFSIKLDHQ
jgi:hypothetical protein